jgi:multidrug efflux pump subunit AcrB
MKSLFSGITGLSVRFRFVTLTIAAVISVAGIIAVTQLRQELIPAVEFPQTIVLAQVAGLTSDQVLTVITTRIEDALENIPEIVNVESTTTGAFGAIITARNDFGLNQERLRADIQSALDSVWLPVRRIAPPAGEDPQGFAQRLLADLPPNVLIYLQENNSNFLFQLQPETWAAFSDETASTLLAYLAGQQQATAGQSSALRQLIDQEIVPALANLPQVASVSVAGGQQLPDENGLLATPAPGEADESAPSLLLQLSPETWAVASAKAGISGALDNASVEALSATSVEIPEAAPALPESWQMDHFKDASDLDEMRTLTRSLGSVFNRFLESGEIIGALGQTDDLTPDVVAQMLAIEPALVDYFEADQLVALSDDVFAALPEAYIANLDGFTRDELAAKALAQTITGADAEPQPVDLPPQWSIAPPQLVTFSFDDLPLATFSVSGTGPLESADSAPAGDTAAPETDESAGTQDAASEATPPVTQVPEGPALPAIFGLIGSQFGTEFDTADDLLNIQLPEEVASTLGDSTLSAAQLFNFLPLLSDPSALAAASGAEDGAPGFDTSSLDLTQALPALVECGVNPLQLASGDVNLASALIGCLPADVIAYLADNDPTFASTLSADVFEYFSDDVLALDAASPPLGDEWNSLASQPEFADTPLVNAADVLALGDGSPSSVLNTINETVPAQFAGYEVRLFNSLTPATLRYFALHEADFYSKLDADVLAKLSPTALAALPEDVLGALEPDAAAQLSAVAAGERPSAADQLASLYASDVPAGDPNAPDLNDDWELIANFLNLELDTADDFFRLPETYGSPAEFINGFFDSARGAAFAPNLLGGLSTDALNYIAGRDPQFFNELQAEALQLLQPDVLAALPQDVQDRAVSGGVPFTPTNTVTRVNGSPSYLITVFKSGDANTVEAYHTAEDTLRRITEEDPTITYGVGFEQSSFIEESISGVAREGGLGAIFAVVVILIFLSSGHWARSPRRIVGTVLVALFLILLGLVVASNAGAVGGDLSRAFEQTDVVVRVLLMLGVISGLVILLWPGNVPRPAWRSTLVTAVSIPLSVLMALALMRWLPPTVHGALAPAAEGSPLLTFLLRLFPSSLTINIMTLSGLTVAIGRVVDDSIVVLENIFRHVQEGEDKRQAIIAGTRDVSVAIFAATVITVVVFLPLGLTGGIIGEFFLPFGLAVTYALLSSFVVAITIVPVVAYLLLNKSEVAGEHNSGLERLYLPALRWSLNKPSHRLFVLGIAFVSLIIGGALFASRPQAFLPSFGEPQISVTLSMPPGTKLVETNALVEQFEHWIQESLPEDEVSAVQSTVGSSGNSIESLILGSSSVDESTAAVTIAIEDQSHLDRLTQEVRDQAEQIFSEGDVTVSGASLSEQGFGGFALVLSGPQQDLVAINQRIIDTLNNVPGLANASSSLASLGGETDQSEAPTSIIRIDGQPALQYTAELETENTLGVTADAKAAILALPDLPPTVTISEGFTTQLQTEGFASLFVAMGIAIAIVIVLLMITFGSLVHWLDIILSIIVAPVGAAVLLTLSNRVLGISAMIGLLMLIGIVVTNAVVLIDRVQSNRRERGMNVYDALVEAGGRRLRPILMTALATICALLPLAIGLSHGAIIASELGTVVIGGLFSSTILTLIIVPVAYMLLTPLHTRLARLLPSSSSGKPAASQETGD